MTSNQYEHLKLITGKHDMHALMNFLQHECTGLISDLCVTPDDVAEVDAENAITTLTK